MSTKAVRAQYEKFPYPPIGLFALPVRGEGRQIAALSARRILVAGCGTLEAVVAAQANPRARITAVDLSASSLKIARTRLTLMKLARPFSRIARVDWICADLLEWVPPRQSPQSPDKFDFILCSNVIHHIESPARLLARLATWLAPDGVLRLVTYPKASRIWMRQAALWLRLHGLTPETPRLPARARAEIRKLPPNHPARVIFESHPEANRPAGIVDAFFHAQEQPLSPLEWREACAESGLELFRESQTETSRSHFLDEILKEELRLDSWSKLEVLDCLLELCANPVLWLRHSQSAETKAGFTRSNSPTTTRSVEPKAHFDEPKAHCKDEFLMPASGEFELTRNLRRAREILQSAGIPIERVMQALASEVGPRVGPPPGEKPLPGLSILDHDWRRML